jgi:hypothetical protein
MRTLFILLFSMSGIVFASNRQVHYEPATVELTGRLDLQTFPGPPNYESIESGDEIERHFYLDLIQPVDVVVMEKNNKSAVNGDSFNAVKILQLVVTKDEQWARLRELGEGRDVTIKGTLFQRFTGHHHARVLLSIESIMHPTKPFSR